jgi:hypothetical protein
VGRKIRGMFPGDDECHQTNAVLRKIDCSRGLRHVLASPRRPTSLAETLELLILRSEPLASEQR